jgi:hypothetical protein
MVRRVVVYWLGRWLLVRIYALVDGWARSWFLASTRSARRRAGHRWPSRSHHSGHTCIMPTYVFGPLLFDGLLRWELLGVCIVLPVPHAHVAGVVLLDGELGRFGLDHTLG